MNVSQLLKPLFAKLQTFSIKRQKKRNNFEKYQDKAVYFWYNHFFSPFVTTLFPFLSNAFAVIPPILLGVIHKFNPQEVALFWIYCRTPLDRGDWFFKNVIFSPKKRGFCCRDGLAPAQTKPNLCYKRTLFWAWVGASPSPTLEPIASEAGELHLADLGYHTLAHSQAIKHCLLKIVKAMLKIGNKEKKNKKMG